MDKKDMVKSIIKSKAIGAVKNYKILLLALLAAYTLSMHGANWGRVEDWNPDQVAVRTINDRGLPNSYLKPPLHTYLNYFLIVKPVRFVVSAYGLPEKRSYSGILIGTRLLTITLFCATVGLIYFICLQISGARAAGVMALLTATSAGVLQYNHYGTADSPLLFWMTASFAASLHGALGNKTWLVSFGGLMGGLAAADKYNGLGVTAAIPFALYICHGWRFIFSPALWLSTIAVPLGFLIGNPGALLDQEKFVQDFLYNLYTTPVYGGDIHKIGYLEFLGAFRNLIGIPACFLIVGGFLYTMFLLRNKMLLLPEKALLSSAGAVFAFYFLTIGRFPRMEVRFVLPVIPFALFLAAPAMDRVAWKKLPWVLILGFVLTYNLICCVELGLRFAADPRMAAQIYAAKSFPHGASVESTCSPDWNRLDGVDVNNSLLFVPTGHRDRFSKIFGNNAVIQKGIIQRERADHLEDFTADALYQRNPDFITFSDLYGLISNDRQVDNYFKSLKDGKMGYVKVFEAHGRLDIPYDLEYPLHIDFLADRMIILKRKNN
jgi:hypothetical protein